MLALLSTIALIMSQQSKLSCGGWAPLRIDDMLLTGLSAMPLSPSSTCTTTAMSSWKVTILSSRRCTLTTTARRVSEALSGNPWPAKVAIPGNITLMPLPPRAPELNPVENIWQFMRENWLSNRVFGSYDDILDHCCQAWNKLAD
jgi:hypothetical protein